MKYLFGLILILALAAGGAYVVAGPGRRALDPD